MEAEKQRTREAEKQKNRKTGAAVGVAVGRGAIGRRRARAARGKKNDGSRKPKVKSQNRRQCYYEIEGKQTGWPLRGTARRAAENGDDSRQGGQLV